jgi:hypothetical protein
MGAPSAVERAITVRAMTSSLPPSTRRPRLPTVVAAVLLLCALVLGACSDNAPGDGAGPAVGDDASSDGTAATSGDSDAEAGVEGDDAALPPPPRAAALCAAGPAVELATVADPTLEEISGLAVDGRPRRGVWAIEDSGTVAALYRIGFDGRIRQTVTLDVANIDWEDLAYDHRTGELVIADTGNNLRERSPVQLHAVTVGRGDTARAVTTTEITYPDEIPDVEALLIDPLTGDRILITKALDQRDFSFEDDTIVYRVPATADPAGGPVVVEEVARLRLGLVRTVTGADIAADGSIIVLRTYDTVLVWDRAPGTTVAEALTAAEPCEAPSPREPQGEAIALAADARSFVTIGEEINAPIWQVSG